VFKIKFKLPAMLSSSFGSLEFITLVAPMAKICSFLSGFELKAITSQPHLLRNFKAMWPRPPIPITPTLSVGFTPAIIIGLKTVIPPQSSGPAFFVSIPSGSRIAEDQ
jgi:hypothetical protein